MALLVRPLSGPSPSNLTEKRFGRASLSNVEFGGPNMDELYVTNGDKVFKRKVKVKGVLSWRPPIKPAPPRL